MMTPLLFFAFLFLLLSRLPGSLCRVTTVGDLSVLEGRSVMIPCHYGPQYASYVKYWCHGSVKDLCTSLVRSDAPRGPAAAGEDKVAMFDDPVQQVFTVTMTELQKEDSGWYWCGVEVGGVWSADVTASLHINVIQGMSVVNSMVSGEEGTSVTVQCLYSQGYRQHEKRWCRSGDWSSCLVTDGEGWYEDQAVEIRDDLTKAFTVTLKGLARRDTGWYWCAAGQQQVAVYILVTPPSTTAPAPTVTSPPEESPQSVPVSPSVSPLPRHIAKGADHHRPLWEFPLMVCGILFILMVLVLLPWKILDQYNKTHRTRQAELEARLSDPPGDDWQNTSVVFLNSDPQKVYGF
ncbi:polymeric immunoglobulin receptor [Oncorhynchus kisutch]|uniref:CMRF35-like molecule 5 n=1 Tax=Oncorhynchus kisutch TaxID=8019 RepID=A0A8C7JFL2_ONCKI|nr:CMRF35-like molecule 5 [Oncorhynchus kisutch]